MIGIIQDKTTGRVKPAPAKPEGNPGMVTYRRPRGTTNSPKPERNQTHPETRNRGGAEEGVLKLRGQLKHHEWNRAPRPAKGGTQLTRPEQTGTGGNAQRPIPTGPTAGTRPNTGNPVRRVTHAKWQTLIARMRAARIEQPKIDLINRVMTATLSQPGVPTHTMTVRIDSITEKEWRRIDAIRPGALKKAHTRRK